MPSEVTSLSVVLAFNITTDVYILSSPLPIFWLANIKLWKKLGLLVLVSGNVFIIAASLVRFCRIVGDPLYGSRQASIWTYRVMFVSVVSTNAPLLAPLFRKWCGAASKAVFGVKTRPKMMMREIKTITTTSRLDGAAAENAILEDARRGRATRARQAGAQLVTSGYQTITDNDEDDVEKMEAEVKCDDQPGTGRRSSINEYPV